MLRKISILVALITSVGIVSSAQAQHEQALKEAAKIPIQHEGRIKSLEVFARETLQHVSTRQTLKKEPALHVLLKYLGQPRELLDVPLIRIDHLQLKRMIGLPAKEKYFSYRQIKPAFPLVLSLVRKSQEKRDRDQRPSEVEQKAEILYSRVITVDKLVAGEPLNVIPPETGNDWKNVYAMSSPEAGRQFINMLSLYSAGDYAAFIKQARQWLEFVYPKTDKKIIRRIYLENLYYATKPFQVALILYLISFILLLASKGSLFRGLGYASLLLALLAHTGGIVLRMVILSRAPVSNMFESMIFMNWVLMIAALIYYFINRTDFILKAGALASALVMVYANLLPIEQTLDVLVPVLRSNYWLTIHVMTIVASYGLFGLAMALGHRHLFFTVIGRFSEEEQRTSGHITYRLIQAGVITLGIGTVLGGVWANESWGRFWGWDPKETWALITFLGYLVVVHLRANGKCNDFWLAVSTILGFQLVLMTWYGVNFLLGRGLHSYGSGSGGTIWIIYYLIFEAVFLLFVAAKRLKVT